MGLDLLLNATIDATTVTIESSLLPPITLDLKGATQGEQSLLVKLLRPRVTVRAGPTRIVGVQPAGDPDVGVPWGLLLAGVLLFGTAALVGHLSRR